MRKSTSLISIIFLLGCSQGYKTPAEEVSDSCEIEVSAEISKYNEDLKKINNPLDTETYCSILREFQGTKKTDTHSNKNLINELTDRLNTIYSLQDHQYGLQSLEVETRLEYEIDIWIENQINRNIQIIKNVFQNSQDTNIPNNYVDEDFFNTCYIPDFTIPTSNPVWEESTRCFVDKRKVIGEYREKIIRSAVRKGDAPDYIIKLAELEDLFDKILEQ